jgi:hypothetical protein
VRELGIEDEAGTGRWVWVWVCWGTGGCHRLGRGEEGSRGRKEVGQAELGRAERHQALIAVWLLALPSAVAAFREWYLSELAASDAQLRQLAADQAPTSAAQQLQATLRRLGLTAGELARLPSGEPISGGGSAAAPPLLPLVPLVPLLPLLLLPRCCAPPQQLAKMPARCTCPAVAHLQVSSAPPAARGTRRWAPTRASRPGAFTEWQTGRATR